MARPTKSFDELTIKITANASQASQELERLTKSITNLSQAISGANVRPFTQDLRDLGQAVKGINANGLNKQMSKLSNSMGRYISSTSKLAKVNQGGVSAFTHLKRGADGIYNVLNKVNNRVNDFASRIRRANKETKTFAQSIGMLYARFWLLIRGAKALTSAVKSSMNYIEVMNYFEASMGQVAERGVSKWSQMGYESAEAYYNSFAERAKEVTKDMSGFYPEKDGTLTPTKLASLGLNPQDLMKYQAQFAQMSSSMGTTSEQALVLSEVLTKIGADLASVKNMDFDQVWGDMASGLVGMSRTLDKYGANIRNSNMDMKLHELGIDANVKSLSQADKALLRTIILLDASKYAWGDLAETLNTPANQFRMLANNVKLLGQMIGNILLPVVAKVLPYLNALVIALQRLFAWLAKILGIDLSKLQASNQGFDNSNLSDMLDDAESLSDALDDDTDSAKKLKKQLQGFDALNNLTTQEDSKAQALNAGKVSGLLNDAFLNAVDDYLKAWDEAFKQLENKAQRIADKIVKFFKHLAKPLAKAWAEVGKTVVQQWKNAGYNLKLLFKQIGKDFWRVWDEDATTDIFKNVLLIWGNIGETVQHVANRFREAWVANDNGYRILASIRDIILIVSDKAKEMSDHVVEWAKHLDFKPLLGKAGEWLESLEPVIDKLMGVLEDFLDEVLLPLGKWVLEKGLPDLLQVFIDFNNRVDWEKLRANLKKLWEHLEPFAERVGEGFIDFIESVSQKLADFLNSEKFEKFLDKVIEWLDSVTAEDVKNTFEALAWGLLGLKVALKALAGIKGLGGVASAIGSIFGVLGIGGAGALGAGAVGAGIAGASSGLGILSGVKTVLAGLVADAGLWTLVDEKIADFATSTEKNKQRFMDAYGGFTGFFKGIKDGYKSLHLGMGQLKEYTNADESLAVAVDDMDKGFVRSESQLQELGVALGWSEEHVDSYKQALIDANEVGKNMDWGVDPLTKDIRDRKKIMVNTSTVFENIVRKNDQLKEKMAYGAKESAGMFGDHFTKEMGVSFYKIKSSLDANADDIGKSFREKAQKTSNIFTETSKASLGNYEQARQAWDAWGKSSTKALDAQKQILSQKGNELGTETMQQFSVGMLFSRENILPSVFGLLGADFAIEYNKISEQSYEAGREIDVKVVGGMESNSSMVASKAQSLMQRVSSAFANARGLMQSSGTNLMSGLLNGIMSLAPRIVSAVTNIANTITSTFSRTWRIHSPSLVMDEMGTYFMQGLQNGIESMYAPIEGSLTGFENDLTSVPEIEDLGTSIGNISASQTYSTDNTETNALLRQQNSILQAILEKEFGISSGALFASVQSSADSYYRQTGRKAFV